MNIRNISMALAAIMLTGISTPTIAQDQNTQDQGASEMPATPAINPACADDLYRQFDFWLGTWDVKDPNGQVAGVNRITLEEGGCLLVERWTGAGGGTGQSYNFVDRDTNQWRQVWVSGGFTIDYSGGLDEDGAMVLKGRIGYASRPENNGPFKGTWTLREDGTVEQTFHQLNPENGEWVPWFTGIYTKVEG